jgi:hypothetical protein
MRLSKLVLCLTCIVFIVAVATTTSSAQRRPACCQQFPVWSGNFSYTDPNTNVTTQYPYKMIGNDPATGVGVQLSVIIIPVEIDYPGGRHLSPLDPVCGTGSTGVNLTLASPLFNSASYASNLGFDVGTTQYVDAFQRASFWNVISPQFPNYHVLFSVSQVLPVQVITITTTDSEDQLYSSGCDSWGRVNFTAFDQQARTWLSTLGLPFNTIPVFLTYNLFLGNSYGGYHGHVLNSFSYMEASVLDPQVMANTSYPIVQDVFNLSHELVELVNNPFVDSGGNGGNLAPAWRGLLPPRTGNCETKLEVADPVATAGFTVPLNGFTYHLSDSTFLAWFARTQSPAPNGRYTFLGTFPSAAPPCS